MTEAGDEYGGRTRMKKSVRLDLAGYHTSLSFTVTSDDDESATR
jgi:hypothetical protein